MPMPKPKPDEERSDFIGRCMGNSVMNREYPDQDQRAGVCYNIWRNRNRSNREGDMSTKSFKAGLKEIQGEGRASVVFATLNVVDKDGDVTMPGAFGNQIAKIAGAHDWAGPSQGYARISERSEEAVADLQYNLEMDAAKEWYKSLKFAFQHGLPQEFSYGFDVLESSNGEYEGKSVRFLKSLRVHEVSPVMVGAGIDTRILDVKSGNKTLEQEFEEVEAALAAAKNFRERVEALAALREKEGRVLSRANRERLNRLLTLLSDVQGDVDKLLRETSREEQSDDGKALNLFAEYQRTLARIRGNLTRSK